MGAIYQHARITIVASKVASVQDNFLTRTQIDWSHASDLLSISLRGDTSAIELILRSIPSYAAYDDPLSTRAWALQEAVLSNHTVRFQTHGVEMTCKHLFSGTKPPDDRIDKQIGMETLLLQPSRISPLEEWENLLENYSARKMKFSADKLIAISAIARMISRDLESKYIAGLWAQHLLEGLLWCAKRPTASPTSYIAPSWSWASCNGSITASSRSMYETSYKSTRVINCAATLKEPNLPFGAVIDGQLEIAGQAYTTQLDFKPDWQNDLCPEERLEGDETRSRAEIQMDHTSDLTRGSLQVVFLAVGFEEEDVVIGFKHMRTSGLILYPTDNAQWRRIGYFYVDGPTLFKEDVVSTFVIV